jgi:hypothetical protein
MLKAFYFWSFFLRAIDGMPAKSEHSKEFGSFNRFFTIVLENRDYEDVMRDEFMGETLSSKGMLLTNFHAKTHPSQPNYFHMVAGSRMGVYTSMIQDVEGESIVDLLERKEITWKTYQEMYPGDCFDGDFATYKRKHNPFISFNNIRNDETRCSKIVNSDQLYVDIENESVPEYVFYTPDMDNNSHDTTLEYSSNWLDNFLTPLLENPYFEDTLFFITFDESESSFLYFFGDNQIYSLLIGPGITPGSTDNNYYSFENILATIEARWDLGNMGRTDAYAEPIELK